jgi:hypothetical protein
MVTGTPAAGQFPGCGFHTFAEVRKRSAGFLHRTDARERQDAVNCAECHLKLGYTQEAQDRRRWNQTDPEPLERDDSSRKMSEPDEHRHSVEEGKKDRLGRGHSQAATGNTHVWLRELGADALSVFVRNVADFASTGWRLALKEA